MKPKTKRWWMTVKRTTGVAGKVLATLTVIAFILFLILVIIGLIVLIINMGTWLQ